MDYIPSYTDQLYDDLYLEHHGILGQKWGVRRYRDANGKLTAEGKQKYAKKIKKLENKINQQFQKDANRKVYGVASKKRAEEWNAAHPKIAAKRANKLKNNPKAKERFDKKQQKLEDKAKKVISKENDKTLKLLKKAGDMGLTRTLSPTIRTGEAWFTDNVAYLGGYYVENRTRYRMNVASAKISLD